MSRSRTSNTARNVAVSLGTQIVLTLLSFASRTVFVSSLGVELLGVNALFLSIISVVSIADLGLNTALMYAMYRPLGDDDKPMIRALLGFCAVLYRLVALAVAVIGLVLTPFVHLLVNTETPVPHLHWYFIAFVANASVGYLMAYRSVLIIADQRMYATKAITFAFMAAGTAAQIVVLHFFESYLLYVVVMLVAGILSNAAVFLYVGRQYPYIKGPRIALEGAQRREIVATVRATLIYRVGGVILNNTDPILISITAGTVALGFYSNYALVVGAAMMLTDLIFVSTTPSIGNLNATSEPPEKLRIFNEVHLLSFLVYGSISVGFLVLLPDLIELWLGGQYVLSTSILLGAVANFYLYGITASTLSFRSATGMFRETRYVLLATAALNVVLSFLLGREYGVPGVLFATVIARLLTNLWFEPWILFNRYLLAPVRPYFLRQVALLGLLAVTYGAAEAVTSPVAGGSLIALAAKAALVLITTTTIFWLSFRNRRSFVSLVNRVRRQSNLFG